MTTEPTTAAGTGTAGGFVSGADLAPLIERMHIAYFSMEIAIRAEMHTYAGGLGILAGDTARSCAELELPVVFVSLASRAGYFRQTIDAAGRQVESPDWWRPEAWCRSLDQMVAVQIEGRAVWIRGWLYLHASPHGFRTPILLLDTDLDQNAAEDRDLTDVLYGGDDAYRLKQEIVLGIGGLRLLRALGFRLHTCHLNEGHAALLTLELLNRFRAPVGTLGDGSPRDVAAQVRDICVFTTHTPVEAGHDRFSHDLVQRLLPDLVDRRDLERFGGAGHFNLTQLALSLSGYVNGVARRHAQTASRMFPGHRIRAITNGVHVGTWTHPAFARLFDQHLPHWQHEPEILVRALQLPLDEIWRCHRTAKDDLVARVAAETGVTLDPEVPILGFARRMTGYKRPLLLFEDLDRLAAIAGRHPFQLVIAGKAHPRDTDGKEAIRRVNEIAQRLDGRIACVFLPNYDMQVARLLVSGSDVWLNTPLPPLEASGTSGMKAALNGVLNLSVLDGWWVEACVEGVTGWAIGADGDGAPDGQAADALYDKLAATVLPLYYDDALAWRGMMRQAIANIAYYFNSQRMMRRYAAEAYLR